MNDRARTAWRQAVMTAAALARDKLPAEQAEVIDAAEQLVLADAVTLHDQVHATVQSQHDNDIAYEVHGQRCPCPASTYHPKQRCKHVLAVLIARRAREALPPEDPSPPLPGPSAGERRMSRPIAEEFLYEVHGVKAVLFSGLLHLAHQRGLTSLTVDVVSVSEALAVMRATVTFTDGLTWSDVGDASPQNVSSRIKPHFIRMASTRAMARCLRNALDIPYVCTVELSDEEG